MNTCCNKLNPSLSIVVPIYNESQSIGKVHDELLEIISEISFEVIYVDDGSTDETPEILKTLHINYPDIVTVVRLYGRNGKASALQTGINYAKGRYVAFIDGDGQDDPNDIYTLLKVLNDKKADMIVGWRKDRKSPLLYCIMSLIFNTVIKLFTGLNIKDSNASLKVIRNQVLQKIPIYAGHYRFLPFLFHSRGLKVVEHHVNHRPRIAGISKYGPFKAIEGFWDMFTVLFLMRNYLNPIHFFGNLGMALLAPGVMICFYIIWLKLHYGYILNRYPLLLSGILLTLSGLQLLCVGLLSEILVYGQAHYHPPPLIREIYQLSSNNYQDEGKNLIKTSAELFKER